MHVFGTWGLRSDHPEPLRTHVQRTFSVSSLNCRVGASGVGSYRSVLLLVMMILVISAEY